MVRPFGSAAADCSSTAAPPGASITLASRDLLAYLEGCGPTTLRQLTRELEWSPPLTVAALNLLVREGYAALHPQSLEVAVQPILKRSRRPALQAGFPRSGYYNRLA